MDFWQNLFILISRLCIASLYIWAASAKLANWRGTIAYMQSKNFPLIVLSLPIAIILQIGGGVLVALGFYTRVGALILILFTIPATIKMHDFWNLSGEMRTIEKTFFMKDVAIIGGLLLLLIFGPGNLSING
ncbi:MAG: DoxX family protein [Chlamydiae bacterium]|nr:DoxX family protein [Chlamydiota bacterium]